MTTTESINPNATGPDGPAITARRSLPSTEGDVARIGAPEVLHGELLCEAVDVHPGERVLDVTGNGATSLAAARRWADVTATDVVDHLLDKARAIAEASGLPLATQVADPQELPFPDDSFDVVLSAFGAMFAPDPQRVADELVRVCRPSGRIGMANWHPESLIGEVFRVMAHYAPRPSSPCPAIQWGTQDGLRELFGNGIRSLQVETRTFTFRYRSPQHMLECFRACYGATKVAFASLDAERQAALAADLIDLHNACNRADDGTLVADTTYTEVVAVVR
jgi:SAM-dependent methyltransferase